MLGGLPRAVWPLIVVHSLCYLFLHVLERSLFLPFLRSLVVCKSSKIKGRSPSTTLKRSQKRSLLEVGGESGIDARTSAEGFDSASSNDARDSEPLSEEPLAFLEEAESNSDFNSNSDPKNLVESNVLGQFHSVGEATGDSGDSVKTELGEVESNAIKEGSETSNSWDERVTLVDSQFQNSVVDSQPEVLQQEWSGSLYCDELNTVVEEAQSWAGILDCIRILCHAISLPLFGTAGDLHGRKFILGLACMGYVGYFLLLFGINFVSTTTLEHLKMYMEHGGDVTLMSDPFVDRFWFNHPIFRYRFLWFWIFVAVIFHGCFAYLTVFFAVHTMSMDLTAHGVALQVLTNTVFEVASQLCRMVSGFLVGKLLYLHIQDFTIVWFLCAIIAGLLYAFQANYMPETKPPGTGPLGSGLDDTRLRGFSATLVAAASSGSDPKFDDDEPRRFCSSDRARSLCTTSLSDLEEGVISRQSSDSPILRSNVHELANKPDMEHHRDRRRDDIDKFMKDAGEDDVLSAGFSPNARQAYNSTNDTTHQFFNPNSIHARARHACDWLICCRGRVAGSESSSGLRKTHGVKNEFAGVSLGSCYPRDSLEFIEGIEKAPLHRKLHGWYTLVPSRISQNAPLWFRSLPECLKMLLMTTYIVFKCYFVFLVLVPTSLCVDFLLNILIGPPPPKMAGRKDSGISNVVEVPNWACRLPIFFELSLIGQHFRLSILHGVPCIRGTFLVSSGKPQVSNFLKQSWNLYWMLWRRSPFIRIWCLQILFFFLSTSIDEVLASYSISVWHWHQGDFEIMNSRCGWFHLASLCFLPFMLNYIEKGSLLAGSKRTGGHWQSTRESDASNLDAEEMTQLASTGADIGAGHNPCSQEEAGGRERTSANSEDALTAGTSPNISPNDGNRDATGSINASGIPTGKSPDSAGDGVLTSCTIPDDFHGSPRGLNDLPDTPEEFAVHARAAKLLIIAPILNIIFMAVYTIAAPYDSNVFVFCFYAKQLLAFQGSIRMSFLTARLPTDYRTTALSMVATLKNFGTAFGSYVFSNVFFDAHVRSATWEAGHIFRVAFIMMVISDVFYTIGVIKYQNPKDATEMSKK